MFVNSTGGPISVEVLPPRCDPGFGRRELPPGYHFGIEDCRIDEIEVIVVVAGATCRTNSDILERRGKSRAPNYRDATVDVQIDASFCDFSR